MARPVQIPAGSTAALGRDLVQRDSLSAVLSDFARTMLTDFRIQGILDQLVERIVEVLEISGAGVTLITAGMAPHFVSASGPSALEYERLQTELDEGPCLTAFESGERVSVPDLSLDERYPAFGPAASALGLAAVFTFPLRHGQGQLGALDLYRDTPGVLSEDELVAAQTLADVVSAYLLNAQARAEVLEAAERFRQSALHDPLTGLPNRALLEQRIDHAAARAMRSHRTVAVLFADLDRFKRVNDTYGHVAGDTLLVAVAARLSALVRQGDTLARVSGDEFVIVCEDLEHASDAEGLARRIQEAFAVPFIVTGAELHVTASIGIASAGSGEVVTYDLVAAADDAMYRAKRRGGAAHHTSDAAPQAESHDYLNLERDLVRALAGGELTVAYQPIVVAQEGRVSGVEALLRWTHPDSGPVAPQTIITLAEQSGLILELGAWVLRQACRERGTWLADHPTQAMDLAVNVSPRQLMSHGFTRTVERVLDESGMEPGSLVLEMTEGILIGDGEHALRKLRELKDLGVRIALDDFGTGYSSLNYLRRFPVDVVKIDRAFVADLDDPGAAAIVASVTRLAHVLGMTVVAEGVATEQQRDQLVEIGCEYAQGYFFARPMPGQQFAGLLDGGRTGPLLLP